MQKRDKIIFKLLFISRVGVRSFQNHNGNNRNTKYCNELARITDRLWYIWPFYLNSQLSKTTKLFIFSARHPCVSKFTENSCAREKIWFRSFFFVMFAWLFVGWFLRSGSSFMSYYYTSINTKRGNRQTLTIFAGDILQCILHENLQYKHVY